MNFAIQTIRETLEDHERIKQKILNALKDTLKNKDIPLEERWKLFEDYGMLLPLSITRFSIQVLEDFKLKEYYEVRKNKLLFINIVKEYDLIIQEDNSSFKSRQFSRELKINILNNLKEELLQTGYFGFTGN